MYPNPLYCTQKDFQMGIPSNYEGFGGCEREILESCLQPGMHVVDIGANIGFLSLIMAEKVGPTGKVSAFEPEQHNYGLLQKNIQLKNVSNITSYHAAVGDYVGTIKMFLSDRGDTGDHRVYQPQPVSDLRSSSFEQQFELRSDECRSPTQHQRYTKDVNLTTLNTCFGCPVGLIKIDVQGFETQVIRGAHQVIKNSPNLILFTEYDPKLLNDAKNDPYEFLELLDQYFNIFDIHPDVSGYLVPIFSKNFRSYVADLMHPRTGRFSNLLCRKKP